MLLGFGCRSPEHRLSLFDSALSGQRLPGVLDTPQFFVLAELEFSNQAGISISKATIALAIVSMKSFGASPILQGAG
ncbi:hypothetical protein GCM10007880_57880 [Mesorhizobium amorphae]|nr:hypothetical protein GCM10007880_57880 [Mesorhizobium amorphae]